MTEMKRRKTGCETVTRPGRPAERHERERGTERYYLRSKDAYCTPSCSPAFQNPSRSLILLAFWWIGITSYSSFMFPSSRLSCEYGHKYKRAFGVTCIGFLTLVAHTSEKSLSGPAQPFHLRVAAVFLGCSSSRATMHQCRVFVSAEMRRTSRSTRRALLILTSGSGWWQASSRRLFAR